MKISEYGAWVEIHDTKFRWPRDAAKLEEHLTFCVGRIDCDFYLVIWGMRVSYTIINSKQNGVIKATLADLHKLYGRWRIGAKELL